MQTDFLARLLKELNQSDAAALEEYNLTTVETIWEGRMRGDQGLALRVVEGMEIVLKVKYEKSLKEEILRLKAIAERAAFGHIRRYQIVSDAEIFPEASITPIEPDLLTVPPSPSPPTTAKGPKASLHPLSRLTCTKGKRSHPKLENFRTKLIRGMMRSIREFDKEIRFYPRSGTHAIDNEEGKQAYNLLKAYFLDNQEELKSCGSTTNAPETNKHRPKSKPQSNTTYSSYNSAFCQEFLAPKAIFNYFQLYVDVVFSGTNCEKTCKRLEVRCCTQIKHNQSCVKVWEQVTRFAKEGMLHELGLIGRIYPR